MSGIWQTAWAIAISGWRATYNRTWRFSRGKTAAILLVAQLLLVYVVMSRSGFGSSRQGLGFGGIALLILIQFAWSGLIRGFTRGQFQLYQGVLVPLFQISPARPIAFLLGRSIEGSSIALRSALIWGYAYSAAFHGGERWLAFLLFFGVALFTGIAASLAGLLTLALIARLSPKGLNSGTFAVFLLSLGAATWAAIYLAGGGTLAELSLLLHRYRVPLYTLTISLLGAPGVLLFLGFLAAPEPVEELYRDGLYRVLEARDQADARPRRSVWLPLPAGSVRAILAMEWISEFRSQAARFRLLLWLAAATGAWFAGGAARGRNPAQGMLLVGGLALLGWGMSYSGQVAATFSRERVTQALYRLAGVSPRALVAAKFAAIWLPSLPIVALPALVGGWRAGLGAARLAAWCTAAMTAGIVGGLGLAAATAGEEPDEPEAQASGRRLSPPTDTQGSPIWATLRTGALILPIAQTLWVGAGQPGLGAPVPPVAAALSLIVLPAACAAVGIWLLVRGWRQPRARRRAA